MPIYDFICESCGAARETLVAFREKDALELCCPACGHTMRAGAVVTLHLGGKTAAPERAPAPRAKACGHTHHCRCAVKLKGPNPLQKQIDAALGRSDPAQA
ncbi:MAG: zinc ribbon domain-containing protein [Deltaproteobacteria bacterium]|nr:zinc ribbon domain-containing protein [Deltaproteobacteria bacterium]